MSEEAIFVAIGIACVVAVLLFIVFIIYCVKKQQDKEQDRQLRQRRAREERHRRQLMRAHIVRPPPYDPNRQNVIPIPQAVIPVSPPPEYKEIATPLPSRRNHRGYGDAAFTSHNGYSSQSDTTRTLTGNVTPVTTVFVETTYINNSSSNNNAINNNNNSGNYINRTTVTTTRDGHVSNTVQIQPQNVPTENSEPVSRSSSSYSGNGDYSYERIRQAHSVTERHQTPQAVPTQELSVAALLRQQGASRSLQVNTTSSATPSRFHDSSSRNAEHHPHKSSSYHNYNVLFGAGQNSTQTENKSGNDILTGRSNSSRNTRAGSRTAARTPRNLLDVNIVTVTPVQTSSRGLQARDGPTRQKDDHAGKSDRISALEELSLI